jgi:hypothetical protein
MIMRVADKLRSRIEAVLRNHPEFFRQESATSPRARREVAEDEARARREVAEDEAAVAKARLDVSRR